MYYSRDIVHQTNFGDTNNGNLKGTYYWLVIIYGKLFFRKNLYSVFHGDASSYPVSVFVCYLQVFLCYICLYSGSCLFMRSVKIIITWVYASVTLSYTCFQKMTMLSLEVSGFTCMLSLSRHHLALDLLQIDAMKVYCIYMIWLVTT